MTREEIIGLAYNIGICEANGENDNSKNISAQIEHFAALVAAAEREACAKTLKEAAQRLTSAKRTNGVDRHVADVLTRHAAAIRARARGEE
jgi:hypothetical protein